MVGFVYLKVGGTAHRVSLTSPKGGTNGGPVSQGLLGHFHQCDCVVSAVIIIGSLLGATKSIFSLALSSQGLEVGRRATINRCRELKRDHWPGRCGAGS